MKKSVLFFLVFTLSILFIHLQAYARPAKRNKYASLLFASTRHVVPGLRQVPPHTDYLFVLIWKNTATPEAFYWHADTGNMICNIYKLHAKGAKGEKRVSFIDPASYTTEVVNAASVKQGDTLQLSPYKNEPLLPNGGNNKLKKTLVIKTQKGNWSYLPVNNISSLPDIIMP